MSEKLPSYAQEVLDEIEKTPQGIFENAYDAIFWNDTPSPREEKRRAERNFAVIEDLGEIQDTIRVSSYGRSATFTIDKNNTDEGSFKVEFSFWENQVVQLWVTQDKYNSEGNSIKRDMVTLWNLLNFISYNKDKAENEEKKHWTLTAPTGHMGYGWAERLILTKDDWDNSRFTEIGITEIIKLNNGVLNRRVWFYFEKNGRKSTHMGTIVKRVFMEK